MRIETLEEIRRHVRAIDVALVREIEHAKAERDHPAEEREPLARDFHAPDLVHTGAPKA